MKPVTISASKPPRKTSCEVADCANDPRSDRAFCTWGLPQAVGAARRLEEIMFGYRLGALVTVALCALPLLNAALGEHSF
jgi:hypothetical protein